MVHLLTSWCNAALRGFSKLTTVTCTPSFWNDFPRACSAFKVETSCFVHALCKSSSCWPGKAGRFPIGVKILTPLFFEKASIFRRCTATSSGDCSYFINIANLWMNSVRSCEMIPAKIAQKFENFLKKKFTISRINWWEFLKTVVWTKILNVFLCW